MFCCSLTFVTLVSLEKCENGSCSQEDEPTEKAA